MHRNHLHWFQRLKRQFWEQNAWEICRRCRVVHGSALKGSITEIRSSRGRNRRRTCLGTARTGGMWWRPPQLFLRKIRCNNAEKLICNFSDACLEHLGRILKPRTECTSQTGDRVPLIRYQETESQNWGAEGKEDWKFLNLRKNSAACSSSMCYCRSKKLLEYCMNSQS